MKRVTVKKAGLLHFKTYFSKGSQSLVLYNVANQETINRYGVGYLLKFVYAEHDRSLKEFMNE